MLEIPTTIAQEMIAHAQELSPHECCGILSGQNQTVTNHYRITNILASLPNQDLTRFEGSKLSDLQQLSSEERADIAFQMDAREMAMAQRDIRVKGLDLIGFYHSHTQTPARPSQTDISIAMEYENYRTKLNLPEPIHLIVSLEHPTTPNIRAYKIQDSYATEIQIHSPS